MLKDLIGLDEFFDDDDFVVLLLRIALNLFFASIVIESYRKRYQDHTYRFTYYVFNIITFALCFLLRKVPVELGFALGMFAVFGILRYRTEPIGIRDLTYLFVVIGLAILNAVANKKISLAELLLVECVIVGLVLWIESSQTSKIKRHEVLYDNLELLRQSDPRDLHEDLAARMGVKVERVVIKQFDLLRDVATIDVYHKE